MLFQSDAQPRRAVSETTAFLMATMLADVIDAGTANRARALGFTLPAAGKTGTTNDFVDAWFVGFTPSLVAGVWVGFDTPRTIIKNGFAGLLAVPMWARFMKAATSDDAPGVVQAAAAMSCRSRSAGCRAACPARDAATPHRSARRVKSRTSRWSTPTTSCAAPSRSTCAPSMRPQYLPYQEPTYCGVRFDGLHRLDRARTLLAPVESAATAACASRRSPSPRSTEAAAATPVVPAAKLPEAAASCGRHRPKQPATCRLHEVRLQPDYH